MDGWESSEGMVLRPPADSAGQGVARISCPEDLEAYTSALDSMQPRLPVGTLTQQQHPLTMPAEPPALLLVEPWVNTDPVTVAVGPEGDVEVTWEGSSSRWLEVSIGLLGELVSAQGK